MPDDLRDGDDARRVRAFEVHALDYVSAYDAEAATKHRARRRTRSGETPIAVCSRLCWLSYAV
jgi:hypothetical protein